MPITSEIKYLYGRRVCQCIIDSMPMIEHKLRAAGAIRETIAGYISQGAYSNGSLSAGTHTGGGCIDVAHSLADTNAKILAWRTSGAIAYPRDGIDSPKFSAAVNNEHCHIVWNGCPHLAAGAASQVAEYFRGGDGLIGNRPDRWVRPSRTPTWQQALTEFNRGDALQIGDIPQIQEDDMQFSDKAGTTKEGKDFNVGQGLVRGQTAYEQVGEIRPKFAKAEKEISELRSQVSTLMARTASFDHAGGLLDIQRALRRGATAYDQVGEIRPRFAKAETQLAELRASLADIAAGQGKDVQQALAEAGAAMQRAADAMIEASDSESEL